MTRRSGRSPNGVLLGFGSTSGPPMLPVLYNNLKRIVQTDDHVMILVEMVHDARIVRMNQEHAGPEIRSWLGDSVGHWGGRYAGRRHKPTSPTRLRSAAPRPTCTSSSASPGSTPTRSCISSRLMIRRSGSHRGAASTSGPRPATESTNTRATRPITRSAAFSAARGFSNRMCARTARSGAHRQWRW